jgi:tetratricopeptide (TPR) repeat protein
MSRRASCPLVILVLSASIFHGQAATQSSPSGADRASAEEKLASQLYNQGKFAGAVAKYQSALNIDANLEPAQAGLGLALLAENKPDEALATINNFLTVHPNSAALLVALGNARFRLADMGEAEQAYLKTLRIDSKNVGAYVGLSHLYSAYSLYGHAYAALKRAHEIDPDDPDVQLLWLRTLPRRERLASLKAYLAKPHADSEADREDMQQHLHYLEKTVDQPIHSCKLVGQSDQAEAKLKHVHDPYADVSAVGLEVRVNNYSHVLVLDSGASGVTINQKAAEKAGLQRLVDITLSGIGDQGTRSGYLAVADRIVIGGLEFHDCVITVSDKKLLPNVDGLIGTDVFASYLIDLDMPRKSLKLSPLPKAPGETTASTALNSEEEAEGNSRSADVVGGAANVTFQPPKDRYIDPTMSNWIRFFRFGHVILVPTKVNGSKEVLFVVDTGAFNNILATRTARSATTVEKEKRLKVKGLSGNVDNVYSAEKVDLEFGRFHQPGEDVTTFDVSNISDSTGTEVSGFLGFRLLSMLEIKIDYRDGLIDFSYRDSRGVVH